MRDLPKPAKDYIDKFRTKTGVVDLYKFLGVARNCSDEEITHAMLGKASTIEGNPSELYFRMTMLSIAQKHLSDPVARAAYDRKLTPAWRRLFDRADTRPKRFALLAFPFCAVIALYRWAQDIDHYSWEPSLSFMLFAMASALCLLLAFTNLGNWVLGKS